jgi:hypothetical protein
MQVHSTMVGLSLSASLGYLRSVRDLACSNSIRAWVPAKLKEMVLFGIVQVL